MTYEDTTLRLASTGPDEEALSHVRHVIAVHLERFAAAEGLRVVWDRA
ncbi:hypothetical protein GCM10023097_74230 [Streptomyces collinus]|uniref:DUF2218 domain-containing protein n=1 Tax=Streptomyces collinus TaxID=42684 RepID=A0AA89TDB8_STRCU|nr:hypothetical protein [Streptomyces collinus]